MKSIGIILASLGFLYLLGTAGASDCGSIGLDQIDGRLVIGLLMLGGGSLLVKVSERIERVKKYERNKTR